MSIAVTGATGQLGRLVVAGLTDHLPAHQVVAVVRDAQKAADLGVTVRVAPYEDEDALAAAFAGVDVVVFISGDTPGARVPQHTNVVRAAQRAEVGRVVYTSAPHADDTTLILAPEHKATEALLRESGLTWTFLRNNWYSENYAGTLQTAAATGEVVSAAGEGRVASASRPDFAAAAVVVATTEGHDDTVYELGGDEAWDFAGFTAAASTALGRELTYRPVSPEQLDAELTAAGLDAGTRGFLVGLDANIAEGTLAEVTGDLSRLIGRPTTPLVTTLKTLA
ncbi:SDR family oxidoreductase [Microlunatus antarcticus]|uniref:NAD(P)H dehydrogenase (Quinone) n=1 Tax=Microlunatus antarcticus TaxID=53388 RepID=A0A7W5JX50_9ACTN|nr:SDR family oxidoreductase [Microlunatus antarcticus]MBB3327929.1 NAD(P)H dehydrogenase (quinone) [Microlunatus antarcticus]